VNNRREITIQTVNRQYNCNNNSNYPGFKTLFAFRKNSLLSRLLKSMRSRVAPSLGRGFSRSVGRLSRADDLAGYYALRLDLRRQPGNERLHVAEKRHPRPDDLPRREDLSAEKQRSRFPMLPELPARW
jgi:hypothetical protein